ncbi:MAG TPA: feruloyl-CoA synthase [Polyangiaceae bacterium]
MMTQARSVDASIFAEPSVAMARRTDGSIVLSSRKRLKPPVRCVGEYLERWSREAPDRPFLMERSAAGRWQGVTYGEARDRVRRLAAGLLDENLSAERPVAILSANSVEHGLLMLACLHIGVPVASISPAYSLLSRDFAKLKSIVRALAPGLVYVDDRARFGAALAAVRELHDGKVVIGAGGVPLDGETNFQSLESSLETEPVERAFADVSPDTVAKIMFTSGSTDEPKGVINTQRMLCANQQAIAQVLLLDERPTLVDWLPWNHTFGGNHNFNWVLRAGGTLYIDSGRPVPGRFDETLANLREIAPTLFFNVPRAYDLLLTALREDAAFCRHFFSRLRLIFYAAAALPQNLWRELERLSLRTVAKVTPMISSWGLTESAPAATVCHFQAERSGCIGVPIPGCELKLVPSGDKLEARVRGPNVTPGYWKRPDLTAKFFDEEGFFMTGDAVRWADPERPERGLCFDGRLGEDFKLSTGTWVSVGELRVRAIAALAPLADDVVVAGHDRDEIGLLVFPNVEACRRLCGDPAPQATVQQILQHSAVRTCAAAGLRELARASQGSASRPTRALLLVDPPSADANEITDKGYINQRAVLTRRSQLIDTLYLTPTHASVIELSGVDARPPAC